MPCILDGITLIGTKGIIPETRHVHHLTQLSIVVGVANIVLKVHSLDFTVS